MEIITAITYLQRVSIIISRIQMVNRYKGTTKHNHPMWSRYNMLTAAYYYSRSLHSSMSGLGFFSMTRHYVIIVLNFPVLMRKSQPQDETTGYKNGGTGIKKMLKECFLIARYSKIESVIPSPRFEPGDQKKHLFEILL